MPRLTQSLPKYSKHRQSGQAVVYLGGREVLLGQHGTAASREKYNGVIAEWLSNNRFLPAPPETVTIIDLIARYKAHAEKYYVRADGSQTSEPDNIRHALRPLRKLYGRLPVNDFSPLKLKAVRDEMIGMGWCRTSINRHVGRIKRVFKWGVEQELVSGDAFHAINAVTGLRFNRSDAKESEPVKSVPEHLVMAIKPHVSAQVWAMVELQWVVGMRPGEVCNMRGCDLDTSGPQWVYRPAQHKNQYRGHSLEYFLDEAAQGIIKPFLKSDVQAYLFSPADAEAERRAKMHEKRVKTGSTPLSCGNLPGTNVKVRPKKRPGDHYTVESYCQAIHKACEKAFGMPESYKAVKTDTKDRKKDTPEQAREKAEQRRKWRAENTWHPHRLRHSRATAIRRKHGLEGAQVALGQKSLSVAEVYAEQNAELARRIAQDARRIGS